MGQQSIESPDGLELRGKPKLSARLNKKAVGVAVALMIGVMLFIMANVSKEQNNPKNTLEQEKKRLEPATNSAQNITKDISDQPFLLPVDPPKLPKDLPNVNGGTNANAKDSETQVPPITSNPSDVVTASHAAPQIDPKMKSETYNAAYYADTTLTRFIDPLKEGSAAAKAVLPSPTSSTLSKIDEAPRLNPNEPPDLNRQSQKQAFLDKSATTKKPTMEIVQLDPPVNDFEVKTGTVIPGVLITHVNSDLPGEIVAQVSQNVFDSTTGRYLLIPQGSKLFGRYDSSITAGQERLLVVWNRIIFPNGTAMDLSGMAGHDKAGTAGSADLVNNHYLKTFGFALLSSLFSAAFILSQPDEQRATFVEPSPRTKATDEIAKQMTDLGAQIARRNMNIQPTIELRKGTKFTVMVNKDLVFPGSYRP